MSHNGDVAVTYYHFRNDMPNDAALSTDYCVVHRHAASEDCSQASSWDDETQLTPASFDMRSAPYTRGYFTGDYEGLDNFGTTFTPCFVEGNGTDPFHPLSDAFYTTTGPWGLAGSSRSAAADRGRRGLARPGSYFAA